MITVPRQAGRPGPWADPTSVPDRRVGLDPVLDIGSYYQDLTAHYLKYAEGTLGWHYGIWDPDVTTHAQALLRSNETLVRGIELGAGSHVLDVGCGVGGFAIWAAQRFGCRVTGLTVCTEHARLARELAEKRNVEDRCRFSVMNMDELGFTAGSFDAIINQDTFCHAADKSAYLAGVHRLLRPGGVWRALDFSIRSSSLAFEERGEYNVVRDGFKIPSLLSAFDVQRLLDQLNFVDSQARDVTWKVLPTAAHIIRHSRIPLWLMRSRLDWLFFSRDPQRRRNHQGHFRAGMAYSKGLRAGYFRYCYYSGSR